MFDELAKTIWLWKGLKAKIRAKFIGAKKSQELRGQVGLSNRVVSIDQGDEPPEFLKAIGAPPSAGEIIAKEMKEETISFAPNADQAPPSFSTSAAAAPAMEDDAEPARRPAAPKAQPKQQPKPAPKQAPAQKPARTAPAAQAARSAPAAAPAPAPTVAPDANVDYVLGILSNLKIPEGYQREMVIIGNSAYSVSVKEQVFLGKKKVERTLEPIGSLPEGVFFADGYSPRVLVENGVVLAIEFLKSDYAEGQAEEPVTLKEHIKTDDAKELMGAFGMKVKKK
ncbi:MAG TPA: hypothetical protein VKM55_14830 [Candidatus Lokiarchaeia archaeon]|nr:hypothetical protein [Candidatus Lokiarchaeia archaeon]